MLNTIIIVNYAVDLIQIEHTFNVCSLKIKYPYFIHFNKKSICIGCFVHAAILQKQGRIVPYQLNRRIFNPSKPNDIILDTYLENQTNSQYGVNRYHQAAPESLQSKQTKRVSKDSGTVTAEYNCVEPRPQTVVTEDKLRPNF